MHLQTHQQRLRECKEDENDKEMKEKEANVRDEEAKKEELIFKCEVCE